MWSNENEFVQNPSYARLTLLFQLWIPKIRRQPLFNALSQCRFSTKMRRLHHSAAGWWLLLVVFSFQRKWNENQTTHTKWCLPLPENVGVRASVEQMKSDDYVAVASIATFAFSSQDSNREVEILNETHNFDPHQEHCWIWSHRMKHLSCQKRIDGVTNSSSEYWWSINNDWLCRCTFTYYNNPQSPARNSFPMSLNTRNRQDPSLQMARLPWVLIEQIECHSTLRISCA